MTIEVENVDAEEDDDWTRELRQRRLRFHRNSEGHVHAMVQSRMKSLQLNVQQYSERAIDERYLKKSFVAAETLAQKRSISYVIINPASDLELHVGDLIYLVRAPVPENIKDRRIDPRIGLKRKSSTASRSAFKLSNASNDQYDRSDSSSLITTAY